MILAAILFGLAIGVALGMLGGGGSVLAVPVFVYVLDYGVHDATTASLLVVAAAALAGGAIQARGANVCWPQVGTFAPAAVAGAAGGSALNQLAGADLLLGGFAVVMLAAAGFTWRKASGPEATPVGSCPPLRVTRTLSAGLLIGVLTGFFGVGGGFLVVPLLALGLRFPMRQAIGTSLVIVAFISLVALAGHLVGGSRIAGDEAWVMAAACVVGAPLGALLGNRVPQRQLGRGFALLVTAVAVYLLAETLFLGGPVSG